MLISIKGYMVRSVQKYLESAVTDEAPVDLPQEPAVDTAQAGEFITFGVYEQDNDLTNGAEPIR